MEYNKKGKPKLIKDKYSAFGIYNLE